MLVLFSIVLQQMIWLICKNYKHLVQLFWPLQHSAWSWLPPGTISFGEFYRVNYFFLSLTIYSSCIDASIYWRWFFKHSSGVILSCKTCALDSLQQDIFIYCRIYWNGTSLWSFSKHVTCLLNSKSVHLSKLCHFCRKAKSIHAYT